MSVLPRPIVPLVANSSQSSVRDDLPSPSEVRTLRPPSGREFLHRTDIGVLSPSSRLRWKKPESRKLGSVALAVA